MQFTYKLEMEDGQVSKTKTLLNFLSKNKIYALVLFLGLGFMIIGFNSVALIFSISGCLAKYIYSFWQEISNVSFDFEIDNFSLKDIINDLEYRDY